MPSTPDPDPLQVTHVLQRIADGDSDAAAELVPMVYEELRRLARRSRAKLNPGQTLQTTALVHEAWIRLDGPERDGWQGRAHFFGAAARAMRNPTVPVAQSVEWVGRSRWVGLSSLGDRKACLKACS